MGPERTTPASAPDPPRGRDPDAPPGAVPSNPDLVATLLPPGFRPATAQWLPDDAGPTPHDGLLTKYCRGELPPDVRDDVTGMVTHFRGWYDALLRLATGRPDAT